MGTPSEEVEVTVKKDTEEKPASFFLFGRRKIKPTDMMFIQAVVRATDCYKSRITGYTVCEQQLFKLRVRNVKFATYLKFTTCENTNKINELW